MGFIQGEARGQHAMFPTTLDDLIPENHLCRVIEAFVGRLDVAELGFVRAEPAETGRPGYDPRDLISATDPLVAPVGGGVRAQPGSDVAAGPAGS